jgi:hypothetical protein
MPKSQENLKRRKKKNHQYHHLVKRLIFAFSRLFQSLKIQSLIKVKRPLL